MYTPQHETLKGAALPDPHTYHISIASLMFIVAAVHVSPVQSNLVLDGCGHRKEDKLPHLHSGTSSSSTISFPATLNPAPHLTHIGPRAEVQWDDRRFGLWPHFFFSSFSPYLSLHPPLCLQKTRKGHPVSDRAKLRSGHSSGCGPLPAPEERLE